MRTEKGPILSVVALAIALAYSVAAPVPKQVPPDEAYVGYAIVLPVEKRQSLARHVERLRFGQSADEVTAALGQPDADCEGGQLCLLPRLHRRRCMTFVVAQHRHANVNTQKDQMVLLWFDAYGRLEIIDSSFPAVAGRRTNDALDPRPEPGWWIPHWLPYRRWLFKRLGLPLAPQPTAPPLHNGL